jgi:histidine triad (HIT) family protein
MAVDGNCLFCQIVAGKLPAEVVAENEAALAFRDIRPCAPTHVLVVPKNHIANALQIEAAHIPELTKLFELAQEVARAEKVDQSGFRLVFNVGEDAANSVAHLHMHLIGGHPLGAMA